MSVIPYSSFEQDFRFEKIVGKGNCATVTQVYSKPEKKYFAHKLIISTKDDEISQAMNEVEALIAIDDPQLTSLHFYYLHRDRKTGNFQLGLILDLCDSTLGETIQARKKKGSFYKTDQIKQFLRMMIPGLAKMQKRGYLHRDIKPDNILLMKGKKADYRLADFGFCLKRNIYSDRNIAGTKEYVSPKLLVKFQNNKISVQGHNIKDDVYSFGKTLLEMMTLEIGFVYKKDITFNKIKKTYGDTLASLLKKMLEESEARRPDFIEIQQKLHQMDQANTIIKTQMSESSMRTKGKTYSIGKIEVNQEVNLNTKKRNLKTKRKTNESSKGSQTTLEHKLQKDQFQKVEVPAQRDVVELIRGMKTTEIPIRYQVSCIAATEEMVFMGIQNQLGVLINNNKSNKRQVRFPHNDNFRQITCFEISSDKETLFFGALNGKFYIISIKQISNIILKNAKSFQFNNVIEMSFVYLNCREVDCQAPISTIYLPEQTNTVIIGHHTGEISVVNGLQVERRISFFSEPITSIRIQGTSLYVSSADGYFKTQPTYFLGIETKQPPRLKFSGVSNQYKCPTTIICFELILDCQANKDITVDQYRHLAALACYNGFIYIISKAMECEAQIRVSYEPVLAGKLKLNSNAYEGYQGLFVGQNGTLSNNHGKTIKNLGEKELSCLAVTQKSIVSGGFHKKLIILTDSQEAIELD